MIKEKVFTHQVPSSLKEAVRLKDYLKGLFVFLETGSAVKKAFKKRQIKVNGQEGKTGYWVKPNDVITYTRESRERDGENVDIDVVYDDEDLMVLRKPAGLASSGNQRSLQMKLQNMSLGESEGYLEFPILAHRLDKATEGLMVAAKTIGARRKIGLMLEKGTIQKKYVLIAEGWVPDGLNVIENEIEGKLAVTQILEAIRLNTPNKTTLVYVQLITGRTHQIRKHFLSIGHPIVGDNLYNREGLTFKSGLLLCAYSLQLDHPASGKRLDLSIPIPRKIHKYLYKKVE